MILGKTTGAVWESRRRRPEGPLRLQDLGRRWLTRFDRRPFHPHMRNLAIPLQSARDARFPKERTEHDDLVPDAVARTT
ncbi:hypothetical protein SAMN02746041_02081 [Desulfacinum hydrothermale DSM 13146]|uniref:Uncharacterized protein n=1 Tax=Desulfacinum hydrothermale DSM 13146 TaxID=1121390 RepID=A0A1W1XMA5_9BACT|nr:hypothetical protein SAMN02746041_02081 [Desulfacinum hydrothermale DSM 13146]